MPDLDLAAVREKHAKWLNQRLAVSELVREEAPDAEIAAAEQVAARLSDTTLVHLPALLDRAARVESLEAALRRSDARYDACAMALGDCGNKRMAVLREVEQAQDERDRHERTASVSQAHLCAVLDVCDAAETAAGEQEVPQSVPQWVYAVRRAALCDPTLIQETFGDCSVPGCSGLRIELERWGEPPFVRLSCGHDPPLPAPASAPVCPSEPRDPTPAGAD